MLNLIVSALVAAAPTPTAGMPGMSADAHAQHQKMGHQPGAQKPGMMKPGMMADMKDCCCMEKMAKMDGKQAGYQAPSGQRQNQK